MTVILRSPEPSNIRTARRRGPDPNRGRTRCSVPCGRPTCAAPCRLACGPGGDHDGRERTRAGRRAPARQHLPERQGARAAQRHRQRHLRKARAEDRPAPDAELAQPARGPRGRQVRHRARRGRQRARDDRGRQAGRGDRHRRRQRHERVLRPAGDQVVRRPARPHPGGRCARHRLCAAGQEDPAAARPEGGRRLHRQTGRRRRLPVQGDGGEQGQRRRDPQPAVHRAGRGARHDAASAAPSTCSVPTRRRARS